ncbi:hypothetical protein RFI_36293, partial [Reticulomyxa filosa]
KKKIFFKKKKKKKKRYKFDKFQDRYKDFSLSKTMEPRLKGNWDPESQDFTPSFKKTLALQHNMDPQQIEGLRKSLEWKEKFIVQERSDPDFDLYVDLNEITKAKSSSSSLP